MIQVKPSQEEKQSSRKRPRFWIFLLIGMSLFFGIVSIIWFFLQQPAIGEVRVSKQAPIEDRDTSNKQKQYQGKYLTFSYPGVYAEKAHEVPVSEPGKESVFLSAADFEGKKIAITVEEREKGNFEASPSFQMRVNKPKEYDKESFSENGFEGFVFAKNSQVFEQTVFFFDEGLFISISVTSPIKIEGLREELMDILKSVNIKE